MSLLVIALPIWVSTWMLFDDPGTRAKLQAEYKNVPPATWTRAKGWVVLFGVVLLETGLTDNPRHAEIGARILRRVMGVNW